MSVLCVTFCVLALSLCATLLKIWLEFRTHCRIVAQCTKLTVTHWRFTVATFGWNMQWRGLHNAFHRHETKGSLLKGKDSLKQNQINKKKKRKRNLELPQHTRQDFTQHKKVKLIRLFSNVCLYCCFSRKPVASSFYVHLVLGWCLVSNSAMLPSSGLYWYFPSVSRTCHYYANHDVPPPPSDWCPWSPLLSPYRRLARLVSARPPLCRRSSSIGSDPGPPIRNAALFKPP